MANPYAQFHQDDAGTSPASAAPPTPRATSTPQDFINTYGDAAKRAGTKLGVAPHILLGQWGLETGWGKSVVPGTNNLGNIKDMTGTGVAATDNATGSQDKYRTFSTPNDFADHYADLITRKYQGAVGAGSDASKFAGALASGGYAQDPRYAAKVAAAANMASRAGNPVLRAANAVADAIMPSANAATPRTENPYAQLADNPYAQFHPKPAQPVTIGPVADDNSFLQNAVIGLGKSFTDLGQGVGQRLRGAVGDSLGDTLGLPTQADVDEKRRLDAPVMATAGGKVGDFVGNTIPTAAAGYLTGGLGLIGSTAAGGIQGAAAPTATGESVGGNAIAGMAGGAAGYGIGRGIGALADRSAAKAAAAQAANTSRDTAAGIAKDAGYVLPPSQTNPGMINSALEGFSGKTATAQKASLKNQIVTNRLAAQELGLDPTQPITKDALNQIRSTAGQAYNDLSNIGTIPTDKTFLSKIADIGKSNQTLAKSFPGMENTGIDKLTQSLNQSSFDSDAAVEAMKHLRFSGNANKASLDPANKALGDVQSKAAAAIEDLLDRHLGNTGQTGLLSNFKAARQQIAKTYSVEKALNDATGDVNAGQLAAQLKNGKPLSGNLQTIAQVGGAFPKATKAITDSMPGISPLDYLAAGIHAGKSALGSVASVATLGVRPLVRAGILSAPYQNTLAAPSYGVSSILKTLASKPSQIAIQSSGVASPQLLKKNGP